MCGSKTMRKKIKHNAVLDFFLSVGLKLWPHRFFFSRPPSPPDSISLFNSFAFHTEVQKGIENLPWKWEKGPLVSQASMRSALPFTLCSRRRTPCTIIRRRQRIVCQPNVVSVGLFCEGKREEKWSLRSYIYNFGADERDEKSVWWKRRLFSSCARRFLRARTEEEGKDGRTKHSFAEQALSGTVVASS